MQTHAYMLKNVATSRDVPKVHLVKQTPLSLSLYMYYEKNMFMYDHIPPQFSLIIYIRKIIIVISMFKLFMYIF